jgi:hypothetical protein
MKCDVFGMKMFSQNSDGTWTSVYTPDCNEDAIVTYHGSNDPVNWKPSGRCAEHAKWLSPDIVTYPV